MKRLLVMPIMFVALLLQGVWLAMGQIWANKTRSALTTIGIVIGVASVTAVIAALTGLKTTVLSEFETFGTNKIYLFPDQPRHGTFRQASWRKIMFKPEEFDGLLEHCPSVESFTRFCSQSQTVQCGEQIIEDVRITGVNLSWHQIENRSVTSGRPFSVIDETHARQVCLITPEVRDKLQLDRDCSGQSILIGRRGFRIVGVVEERIESSMFSGGKSKAEALIPFDTAWKLWEPWMGVIATCRTPQLSEEAQAELKFFMRRSRKLEPGEPDTFELQVVEQAVKIIKQIGLIVTGVAGGIVGISLLVGGIGIMNIMLVSVSERTREIGLRKAVGARPSTILLQFLIEAVTLCLLGGLIGVAFGQLLISAVAGILKMVLSPGVAELLAKPYIPMWAIAVSFGFSAFVGVFFGMFPAIKAAQLDPIEALRHE